MSGFAVACDQDDRRVIRRISGWTKGYLGKAVLVALGYVILGVFAAARPRFGDDVTRTHLTLVLILPMIWLAAIRLAGGPDNVATVSLTPLHVDHPQLSGFRLRLTGVFDRCIAAVENWSLAPRPADLAEDLLGTGSGVGRVVTDFRR